MLDLELLPPSAVSTLPRCSNSRAASPDDGAMLSPTAAGHSSASALGPSTPDLSERDDTPEVSDTCATAQEEDGEGDAVMSMPALSLPAAAAPLSVATPRDMETAMQRLLLEVGVDPLSQVGIADSPAIRAQAGAQHTKCYFDLLSNRQYQLSSSGSL